jgi:hypothetical protein
VSGAPKSYSWLSCDPHDDKNLRFRLSLRQSDTLVDAYEAGSFYCDDVGPKMDIEDSRCAESIRPGFFEAQARSAQQDDGGILYGAALLVHDVSSDARNLSAGERAGKTTHEAQQADSDSSTPWNAEGASENAKIMGAWEHGASLPTEF